MYKNILVGADPEVFIVSRTKKPISAEGLIGGSKENPLKMKDLPDGFFVQEDNVAAEFNIPPAKTQTEFANHIFAGLSYISKMVKKYGHKIAITDALLFDEESLSTPHAQRLGCEPDFCVWTGKPNLPPLPPKQLRTAAGHVHVSWTEPKYKDQILLGKALDLYLGVPSVLAFPPSERRTLYGKAGAIRFKPYGIEYRTLPNHWIASKQNCWVVFAGVKFAVEQLNKHPYLLADDLEENAEKIQHAINTHDAKTAQELVQEFSLGAFA